ncbi:MAG: hypothetical protein IJQ39_05335 [Thermoguttaceae bacterium]|nr:hypothetical protein [Thermoguttaceae bacterium]
MNYSLPKEIESLCVLKQDGQDIPLWPYVVAVSGHRTFAKPGEVEGLPGYELETIKKTFKKELEDLARLWKESCNGVNAPLILLTGMAEGADQLVVEAARELPADLNVKVIAILPMEKSVFMRTLSKENLGKFEELLESVHMTYALPMKKNPGDKGYEEYIAQLTDVDNPDTEDLRQAQYEKLSKFLALHCHVLFAFWDGIDVSKTSPGGTSTALHYKLEGNTKVQTQSDLLTYTSVGPVVHFLLPRINDENRQRKEAFIKICKPDQIPVFYWSKRDLWDKSKKRYFFPNLDYMTEDNRCKTNVSRMTEIVNTLERIGELNSHSFNHMPDVKDNLAQSRLYLFECQESTEGFCDDETEVLINHYTYADQLAEWFKKRMLRIVNFYLLGVILFLVSSALLSSLWEIRQNDWGRETWFSFVHKGQNTFCDMLFSFPCPTILYWISILGFIGVYAWAVYGKYRPRFYRSRAVAEALRVQIFWRIAEMSDCVSGHYRTHQLPETDWLRAAINGLDVLLDAPKKENFKNTRKERLTFVRDVWINGQLKYFQKNLRGKDFIFNFENVCQLVFKWIEWLVGGILHVLWFPIILFFPLLPNLLEYFHTRYALPTEWAVIIYGLILASIPIYGFYVFWKAVHAPQSDKERYKQMLFPFDRAILLLKPELARENIDELLEAETGAESESKTKSENKMKELQTVVRQLGTEAVSENASWYLSMGERKLSLPR